MRSLLIWSALAALLLTGLLTGCSGEEGVVDDGSQAAVVDAAGLDAAGIEILSSSTPASVERAGVVDVLVGDDVEVLDDDVTTGLAFDPDQVAGLLATLGDGASYVVLVFDDPASAAVFAGADPEVFSTTSLEGARKAFLAGSLVAYAGPDATPTKVRRALNELGGSAS